MFFLIKSYFYIFFFFNGFSMVIKVLVFEGVLGVLQKIVKEFDYLVVGGLVCLDIIEYRVYYDGICKMVIKKFVFF